MHITGRTYEELTASFRWELPSRFNIAAAISDRHAAATPDAVALTVEAADGSSRRWTARQLNLAANRLANGLTAVGVGRGTVVAVNLPQSAESCIVHIAIQKCGAIALPLFVLFGPDAVRYRLADSGARVLITTVDGLDALEHEIGDVETLSAVIAVVADRTKPRRPATQPAVAAGARYLFDFDALLARSSEAFATVDTGADDPALLMYTSGTTGQPKGVLHAGRVLLGHLPNIVLWSGFSPQPGDRFWTPADWAWAGGLLDVMLPSLYWGIPLVASQRGKFDPEWAFGLLARHDIRVSFLPPTALRLMRSVARPGIGHGLALRAVGSGGETLGRDMIEWGREHLGVTIAEFFGQTEVNLVVGNSPGLFEVRPGSMGRASPGHVVDVVDEHGRPVPVGSPGIVAVRRPDPVMFLEYWRRPEATAEKFRGDWCLLGDVARKDEDGYFWYQGRDDDLINSAGYRIGPGEVEDCLGRHPAVAMAGVIGSPDALRGEIVTAFIVARPGYEPGEALAADIQAFVKSRLAAHEYPRRIRFLPELPMTVTGKVRRRDLRDLDAAAATRPATQP